MNRSEEFRCKSGAKHSPVPCESVIDAMLVMDEHYTILSANHDGENILGYTGQELIGKSFPGFMPECLREPYRKKIELWILAGCVSYTAFEWFALSKDGREIPLNLSFGYVHEEGHDFLIAMIRDLSKCKRLEADLARSNARLDAIINSAMDAIVSIDADQRIVVFNPAAEQMFGLPARQAIGSPIDRLMPERFRATHREHVCNFSQSGKTSRGMGSLRTVLGLRANGEEFPIEACMSQIEVLREVDGKSIEKNCSPPFFVMSLGVCARSRNF